MEKQNWMMSFGTILLTRVNKGGRENEMHSENTTTGVMNTYKNRSSQTTSYRH